MSTIYIKTHMSRMIPGLSFKFRPGRSSRKNTVLLMEPAVIHYVTEGMEEIQTIETSASPVYMVMDRRQPDIWGRFMATLNDKEASLFRQLAQVDKDSLWGMAIHNFLQDPEKDRFRDLLLQLSSQAKDEPSVMADIVGQEFMIELLGYVSPIF